MSIKGYNSGTTDARLTVISGPFREQRYELAPQGWPMMIGREQADLVIRDPSLSRRHAELCFRDGQWALRDLQSRNGTFVNGRRVTRPQVLRHGDQIQLGLTVVLFETQDRLEYEGPLDPPQWPLVPDVGPDETLAGADMSSLTGTDEARHVDARLERIIEAGQRAVSMSHGIKNILQAVSGGREAVEHGLRTKDLEFARRGWEILSRNLDLIQKLVLDMLEFSRDRRPVIVNCDVNSIVRSAAEALRPRARKERKQLEVQLHESLPGARMDPDRIYDVVLNLTLNAIRAVPEGTGRVVVTSRCDADRQTVEIAVGDNGPGIGDKEAIFEPFHTTNRKDGVGLGLPIARKIVTQHGGQILVESEPGHGATFRVRLPIRCEEM